MDRILYDLPFLRAVLKQDNSRREEALNERMSGAAEAIGEKKMSVHSFAILKGGSVLINHRSHRQRD